MGDDPPARAGDHRAWCLLLPALLAWQGWMVLGLFGGARPWEGLVDDRPILSGRHPLHLYHGYLGARALREHGNLSCYDPAFHAGYPKTPVFDSGSRPAELFLSLAGGRYCPAAYKLGLAVVCAFVPLLLFAAARGAGLSRAAAGLGSALGLLVWWGRPCRDALEAGDIDLLLAALLMLVQAGLLLRYHRDPGPLAWLGVLATTLLGWFAHPLLLSLLLPLFLVYYLSVGTRHRLVWHLALLGGLLAAVGANSFWLLDWVGYWWIRVPPPRETPLLTEPTFRAVWEAPCWGDPGDRALACVLVAAAAVGVFAFNQTGRRAAARLFGLAWAGFLALAAAGLIWEPVGRFGTDPLPVPALLFAALPAAHALAAAVGLVWRWRSTRLAGLLAAGGLAAFVYHAPPPALTAWAARRIAASPLLLGLDEPQRELLETLRARTTPAARILWEDRRGPPTGARWTPLLPLLTERSYVGGLDAEAGIEHTANGLADQLLAGRPVRDWSDQELGDYCRRYNIGWVVCWSPAACERLGRWPNAERTATLPPPGEGEPAGCLFAVRRGHSYALYGSAKWLGADARCIVLGDVKPDAGRRRGKDGKAPVLLSLHYQAGMRASPGRVEIEPFDIESAKLPPESTPFVRLWVAEPVTRVTITWDKR